MVGGFVCWLLSMPSDAATPTDYAQVKTKPIEWDVTYALRTKPLRSRFAGRMSISTSIVLIILPMTMSMVLI